MKKSPANSDVLTDGRTDRRMDITTAYYVRASNGRIIKRLHHWSVIYFVMQSYKTCNRRQHVEVGLRMHVSVNKAIIYSDTDKPVEF